MRRWLFFHFGSALPQDPKRKGENDSMACRVLLIASTPSRDAVVAAAARICYSDASAADLLEASRLKKAGSCFTTSGKAATIPL